MPRVLNATCEGGVVTAEGVTVPGAVILSEGVGASSGLLFLDGDKKTYIGKTSPDLETTLEKTIAAINKIAEGLTAAGSALDGIAGGSGTPVTTAATQLAPIVAELETLKGQLK